MTREIKLKMNTRDWSNYKRMRNRVSCLIRQSKANYVRSIFRENRTNPKNFWRQIKMSYPVKNTEGVARSFKVGNEIITDKKDISNMFCSFLLVLEITYQKH